MKAAYKTTEFWAALIGQLASLAVLFGVVTADQGTALASALQAIAGGVLSIISVLGFNHVQIARKQMLVDLAGLRARGDSIEASALNAIDALRREI